MPTLRPHPLLILTLAAALLLPACRPEDPPPPAKEPTSAAADPAPAPASGGHDKAYWRAIVEKDYAVPPGAVPADLVIELARYTGSPDPELRDDFGYMIPAAWIERDQRLSPQILRELLKSWKGNLRTGLGETGTDTVLLRSFSALHLATLARVDNEHPYLAAEDVHTLLDEALAYLAGEKDLRSFESGKGWIHATAHTADLLAALAASPHLRKTDPKRILDAVTGKLSTAPNTYTWGEEERLAAVVQALIQRKDFDAALLAPWLAKFKADSEKLWEGGPQVDPTRYARVMNEKHLLRALYVSLDRSEEATEATQAAKKQVGETLGGM
ncbi:MAG TPA: DUF2785 domain-containing protein [Thermoanaerobaculia bacterium]|nr:DUF2785 domain-containing protein [Thermoanaerobaculia bacterium]